MSPTALALEARIREIEVSRQTVIELCDEIDRLPADEVGRLYRLLVEQLAPWR